MRSINTKKGARKMILLAVVLLTATMILTAAILTQSQNQNTTPLAYQTLLPYMNTPANPPTSI